MPLVRRRTMRRRRAPRRLSSWTTGTSGCSPWPRRRTGRRSPSSGTTSPSPPRWCSRRAPRLLPSAARCPAAAARSGAVPWVPTAHAGRAWLEGMHGPASAWRMLRGCRAGCEAKCVRPCTLQTPQRGPIVHALKTGAHWIHLRTSRLQSVRLQWVNDDGAYCARSVHRRASAPP